MKNEWQKGIQDLKNKKMTKEEKGLILNRILLISPYAPVLSIWANLIKRKVIFVSMFLIFILGSGAVFASERSLPGNILYPLKTKVTEPIRDIIKILPRDNIQWQAEKATRRLEEIEVLTVQNKLDDKKRDELEALFDNHTTKFDDTLNAFTTPNQKEKKKEIEDEFENSLSAHKEVLKKIKKNENEPENISKLQEKLEKRISKKLNEIKDDEDKNEEKNKKVEKLVEKRLKSLKKIKKR